MPEKIEQRTILGEFYDANKTKRWFERAEFVTKPAPTIEVYCLNKPDESEMTAIIQFAKIRSVAIEIIKL